MNALIMNCSPVRNGATASLRASSIFMDIWKLHAVAA